MIIIKTFFSLGLLSEKNANVTHWVNFSMSGWVSEEKMMVWGTEQMKDTIQANVSIILPRRWASFTYKRIELQLEKIYTF